MKNQDQNELLDTAHILVMTTALGGFAQILGSLFYLGYGLLFLVIAILLPFFTIASYF